jgi:hypothetical protein
MTNPDEEETKPKKNNGNDMSSVEPSSITLGERIRAYPHLAWTPAQLKKAGL